MKKNILITWTSRWLWRFLAENLNLDYNIFWISRTKTDLNIFEDIDFDLTNFDQFDKILWKIDIFENLKIEKNKLIKIL